MGENKYIFNASFYATPEHREQWKEWLYNEFLPAVNNDIPGLETEVFEVLSAVNNDMLVFSVQLRCSNIEELKTIQLKTIPVFKSFKIQFGERVTNFNSVLKKID